jgi:indole-3-glycerol phosphate synthase
MSILDQIIVTKHKEVAERKALYTVKLLEQSIHFEAPTLSLKKYLQRPDKSGVIAEIKRKSPSKGVINQHISVERVSIGYMQGGASALSVLTDQTYFGGNNEDLLTAREFNYCPILRKDFIIDEYQIVEAKSIGADAILLIAAALTPDRLSVLADFARSLKLEVLMEVHDQTELQNNLSAPVDMIGVNNRNLKTFETDIATSKFLASHIPDSFVKVTESGLNAPAVVNELKQHGYEGFLIGEAFMKHSRPEEACKNFIDELSFNKEIVTV